MRSQRGQKPNALGNTPSPRRGAPSIAEASGVSPRFQILPFFSRAGGSANYPAELAAGGFFIWLHVLSSNQTPSKGTSEFKVRFLVLLQNRKGEEGRSERRLFLSSAKCRNGSRILGGARERLR